MRDLRVLRASKATRPMAAGMVWAKPVAANRKRAPVITLLARVCLFVSIVLVLNFMFFRLVKNMLTLGCVLSSNTLSGLN